MVAVLHEDLLLTTTNSELPKSNHHYTKEQNRFPRHCEKSTQGPPYIPTAEAGDFTAELGNGDEGHHDLWHADPGGIADGASEAREQGCTRDSHRARHPP
jgi:hypothetical protein